MITGSPLGVLFARVDQVDRSVSAQPGWLHNETATSWSRCEMTDVDAPGVIKRRGTRAWRLNPRKGPNYMYDIQPIACCSGTELSAGRTLQMKQDPVLRHGAGLTV
jgi:hypothetical protein